jgi:hypothetical protein
MQGHQNPHNPHHQGAQGKPGAAIDVANIIHHLPPNVLKTAGTTTTTPAYTHRLNMNFISRNGHFICDEGNTGQQAINCTRNKAALWETFTVDWGGTNPIRSGMSVTIQVRSVARAIQCANLIPKAIGHPHYLAKHDATHLQFDATSTASGNTHFTLHGTVHISEDHFNR